MQTDRQSRDRQEGQKHWSRQKKWGTITVFVRHIQGGQEELDSDKIVPCIVMIKKETSVKAT